MKPSDVDFSKKPGPPLLGWCILLLGVLLLLSAWALKQHWSKQAITLQRQLSETERETARQQAASSARATQLPAEARRWAHWKTQQSLPWQEALQAVDAASSDPVYLLGLTWQGGPDGSPGQLKLEAQAPGWNEALVFVDKLQRSLDVAASTLFGGAQLSSQQQSQDASTSEPVQRFVVTVPLRWTARDALAAAPAMTAATTFQGPAAAQSTP
jgi:hypothetical protein